MLKINKSILIICMVSLFLIIGQISASDSDLIENNQSNITYDSAEISDFNEDALSIDTKTIEKTDISILSNEEKDIGAIDESSKIKLEEEINSNSYGEDEKSLDYIEKENRDGNQLDSIKKEKRDENSLETIEKEKNTAGIVMANDNYSCGPASLATALNRLGLDLSLNQVSKHTNTSLDGTTMQSLIDAAKYYNLSACGVEIDAKNLKENYIVHLNLNGCEHWTVISKVTDTHVFLADSTEGNINFTIDEFNSFYTNKSIVLSKNSQNELKDELISNQIDILDMNQCISISGKGLKKKVIGYRIVWKYGWIRKYGWVLRPVVSNGHVSFSQWKYVKGYYNVWGKIKVKEPIYKYYYVSDEALTSAKIIKPKK